MIPAPHLAPEHKAVALLAGYVVLVALAILAPRYWDWVLSILFILIVGAITYALM